MNILIVDDDPDQLSVRKILLSQFGFVVNVASDERSAMKSAEAHKPVLALIDLKMPTEEVGLRLIRTLKRAHPKIRLLVLTGGRKDLFETLPERELVEGVIEKGSPASDLIKSIKTTKPASNRRR